MRIEEVNRFALHAARQVKHAGLVISKKSLDTARASSTRLTSAAWHDYATRHPYTYTPGMYRRSFLNWDATPSTGHAEIPRRIFVLWTGDNPLPTPRTKGLEAIRRIQHDFEITLVTPENIDNWIIPEHPLHSAYPNLSLVHRSDYLRAYLLHHHGGGYSDIKAPCCYWGSAFAQASADNTWLLGYPERSTQWVAQLPRKLGRDLKRNYRTIPGGSAYVVRADSTFTREWMAEVERRLDYFAPLLEQHPGGMRNEVPEYPIGWNDLLAKIIHPLSLKHRAQISVMKDLTPDLVDYQ